MSYRLGLPDDAFRIRFFETENLGWVETISLAVYCYDLVAVVLPMEEAAHDKERCKYIRIHAHGTNKSYLLSLCNSPCDILCWHMDLCYAFDYIWLGWILGVWP